MDGPAPEGLALAPLLVRIAAELDRCGAILSRVEHSVHDILDHHRPGSDRRSWQKNLQDIDLLEQKLGDLALCLRAVAAHAAPCACDAPDAAALLAPLRLDDLRQRLIGRPEDASRDPASDVEVF